MLALEVRPCIENDWLGMNIIFECQPIICVGLPTPIDRG